MFTLYAAMLVTLGFLIAALLVVVLLPAYRRRVERFATEALKRTLPLTEAEILADRDRLRAEFAMELHKLEVKLEDSSLSAARQTVEVNRRDAKIQELSQTIADHKVSAEEHENARRVLEQAILDRLPKVEARLTETRKLLAARDKEISQLVASSAKQSNALDEATQLNAQREKEIGQLKTTLETRAARNRELLADQRKDAMLALKTELEQLREKSREQASLISKLQIGRPEDEKREVVAAGDNRTSEVRQLSSALAAAEAQIDILKAEAAKGGAGRSDLDAKIAQLEVSERAAQSELAKLRASLKVYEEQTADANPSISQKADLNALEAEVEEQRLTIAALRAEVSASQERLARQAQHFHDEVSKYRRPPADDDAEGQRPSLAERLVSPRVPPKLPAAHLRPVNGGNGNGTAASTPNAQEPPPLDGERPPPLPSGPPPLDSQDAGKARRPRLLERISGLDKPG